MEDPSTFAQIKPQFPEQEQLKCPRCDSNNTKFCYYNNYNLSQPRHFCKNCRRYWTKGGALRNIPVGGRSHKKTKRSSAPKQRSSNQASTAAASSAAPAASAGQSVAVLTKAEPSGLYGLPVDDDRRMLDSGGSFSSLLASHGQFGNLLEGLNPNWSPASVQLGELGGHSKTNMIRSPPVELPATAHNSTESLLTAENDGDSGSCWSGGGGGNGWPELSIYTPGSSF